MYFTAIICRLTGKEALLQADKRYRAAGLHSAMYVLPISSLVLSLVLGTASRRLPEDIGRLERRAPIPQGHA